MQGCYSRDMINDDQVAKDTSPLTPQPAATERMLLLMLMVSAAAVVSIFMTDIFVDPRAEPVICWG